MYMKRRSNSICIGLHSTMLAIALAIGSLAQPAYCQATAVTLLLQQTPTEGGTITPSAGLHHFAPHSQIVVTAVAQPGYQFIFWLGDVGDPTAETTTVYLDGSKVIVAVFGPIGADSWASNDSAPVAAGGGGAVPASGDYVRQGLSGTGGAAAVRPNSPQAAAPIPEPATILLLSLGVLTLRRRRDRQSFREPFRSYPSL
jgi:hypothetical protein